MNVSLGSLRQRLLAMRAWDSSGKSLDEKLNSAINQALDRLAGDVPEALIPDEEHVVLQPPQKSGDDYVKAYLVCHPTDKRLLLFVDKNGVPIDSTRSLTTWRPRCTGEWDGIMHIEVKDPSGRWHRRQCREFFFDDQSYAMTRLNIRPFGTASNIAVGQKAVSFVRTSKATEEANKITKAAMAQFREEYDYTQNKASANNVAKVFVNEYLAGAGTKSAVAAFKASSRQDAADKLSIAQANGLPVEEVNQAFLSQFRAKLRSRGIKFSTFDSYGGALQAKKLPFAADPSYDVTVRSLSTKTKDFEVFDHDPTQLFKKNREPAVSLHSNENNGQKAQTNQRPNPDREFHQRRQYMVTLDRPWRNNLDGWSWYTKLVVGSVYDPQTQSWKRVSREIKQQTVGEPMEFRIYQPEFFLRDDVTELHEPAVVYDETQQQIWSIDTAGADRAGMRDYQGDTEGRPVRMFRGRHFQLPAPTEPPKLNYVTQNIAPWVHELLSKPLPGGDSGALGGLADLLVPSGDHESLRQGTWSVCYTYVWGRRDKEWQQAPNIAPKGHRGLSSEIEINWAHTQGIHASTLRPTSSTSIAGITDPTWESAPSPAETVFLDPTNLMTKGAILVKATNIDAMLGFSDPYTQRFGRSGLRLRFYVSHNAYEGRGIAGGIGSQGAMANTETGNKFYLLCEVEPTYDEFAANPQAACQFFWRGSCLYDIERPLRHSTGYYAYKTYPVQDSRYELDLRVSRLPKKLIDDQDTPPIQRDAISALIELSAYYVALLDGADQAGAQVHLDRYTELARRYRSRYANPAKIVEPTSIIGGTSYRSRNGLFGNYASLKQDS